MTPAKPLIALRAEDAPPRTKPSNYPEPFASMMAGRLKRPLGDLFGLSNFGVNLTRLAPNSVSALRHAHTKQDEFIYVLQGRPVLITDEGRTALSVEIRMNASVPHSPATSPRVSDPSTLFFTGGVQDRKRKLPALMGR